MSLTLDAVENNGYMNEVSAGVYKVKAVHALGPSIEMTGADENKLMAEVKAAALKMELDIERKSHEERPKLTGNLRFLSEHRGYSVPG
jgi:hypothetical protein